MDKKLTIKQAIKDFNEEIQKIGNIEEAFESYMNKQFQEFDGEVDYSETKNDILEMFKISQTLKLVENQKEKEDIFNTTLSQYEYKFEEFQIRILNKLIEYDKSCIIKEKRVFYRLTQFLNNIYTHVLALKKLRELEKLENIIEKGIARTPYTKVIDAITPRMNTFERYIEINHTSSAITALNIYEEFKINPLEISAMYAIINGMNKNIFLEKNREKVDSLFNQKEYLNSSKKLEESQIFRSCQISSYLFYKNETILDKSLQLGNYIPYSTLAKYINILLESFFDYEFISNITKKHIEKKVQTKDYFNGLELLEYRTKTNCQTHPIFTDLEFA